MFSGRAVYVLASLQLATPDRLAIEGTPSDAVAGKLAEAVRLRMRGSHPHMTAANHVDAFQGAKARFLAPRDAGIELQTAAWLRWLDENRRRRRGYGRPNMATTSSTSVRNQADLTRDVTVTFGITWALAYFW
jgi:hypothetical protein